MVHVTRMDGLTDTDTVSVFVLPRPKVEAGEDVEICQGDQVQLSATTDFDIRWYPGEWLDDPTLPNPTALVDTSTTFGAVVTDHNGCHGYDQMTIFVTAPPMADAGRDKVLIALFEFRLEATLEPGNQAPGVWFREMVFSRISYAPDTRVTELGSGRQYIFLDCDQRDMP